MAQRDLHSLCAGDVQNIDLTCGIAWIKIHIQLDKENRAMEQSPTLTALDHLVLTVADIDGTCLFYQDILGMQSESFIVADGSRRWALKFGIQKINLHQVGAEFDPKSANPTAGSADLCFLTSTPLNDWMEHLSNHSVTIEDGPVTRTGATRPIVSIYIRDPDRNLIEISIAND
jgi:catechol 2,3-dioxygenase-like lactoylglutathione lyase family enzyme